MINEQEFNGTITITKKWVGDDDYIENRPFPQLVLTTDIEVAKYRTATIDRSKWDAFWNNTCICFVISDCFAVFILKYRVLFVAL